MLVPRSYRYASSPPKDVYNEQSAKRGGYSNKRSSQSPASTETRPQSSARPNTDPVKPATKPVAVPHMAERGYLAAVSQTMPTRGRKVPNRTCRRMSANHDPDALSPSVAALLAVTAIPPPRPHQLRRKLREQNRVSIDELVNQWRSDEALKASFSSSPGLSILLESVDECEESYIPRSDSAVENGLLHTRSTSSESVPSLEADDRSVLSVGSPATPGSLRSRRSTGNLKRERGRSFITPTQDSTFDHPLVETAPPDENETLHLSTPRQPPPPKTRSSFTSNLTISLRALKKSISAFTLTNSTTPSQRQTNPTPAFSDEILWSHPFLFPRLSSEIRPTITGTPTQAQRRYLNPTPLTFEEQEAPFQQALHAPFLAEHTPDVPVIPLQTYNRRRREGSGVNSEAGRALQSVRQREPRENSDFLRVVVLEMNMRREGKLESGRARIWLPPRQSGGGAGAKERERERECRVPRRWRGVSAGA